MNNILLFGGGNHLSYCIDIVIKENKYKIVGVVDSIQDVGSELFGYKVVGRQEDLNELIEKYDIYGGLISIGDNWSRHYVYESLKKQRQDFIFVNAIHPSVCIGINVKMGKGIIAMAGVIFNPNSVIGDFCFFATGSQLEHDCVIDEFASISAGSITGGKVHIKRFAAITLGVTILDRITIGENTVVGSGSLVIQSLPDNVLAFGNPAKVIRSRESGERFLKST
jgi:sugar O-acyltransferase (sialic acid O-acetyltransferase NeuD family)